MPKLRVTCDINMQSGPTRILLILSFVNKISSDYYLNHLAHSRILDISYFLPWRLVRARILLFIDMRSWDFLRIIWISLESQSVRLGILSKCLKFILFSLQRNMGRGLRLKTWANIRQIIYFSDCGKHGE